MNEYSKEHFLRSADIMRQGQSGQTCIFDWRSQHTGTYDEARGEYIGGSETRTQTGNVACMVYHISGNDITYGQWGSAQVGDLVMALDRSVDLDDYDDLKIIYNQREYAPQPESDIPMDSLAGVIGDTAMYRVLHCRFIGKQQGVI